MPKREDTTRLDPQMLRKPIVRILRPLVVLMIRAGIPFPDFMDLVRSLYVQTAEREFSLPEKSVTDSRISLLTGVHRKEVRRLRVAPPETDGVPPQLSLTGRILTRWLGSPSFTDDRGRPLVLPRTAEGAAPSFDALVMHETKDVHPRSILDDWLVRGLASLGADGRIALEVAALVPEPGAAEQMHFFGRNLHDHFAAAVTNVIGPAPVHLERSVHYDRLSEASAKALAGVSRQLAIDALAAANREAQAVRETGDTGDWRWNFGLYVYLEQNGDPAARPAGDAGAAG